MQSICLNVLTEIVYLMLQKVKSFIRMSNMCLDSILLHPQPEPMTYCLQLRTQQNIWLCFVLFFYHFIHYLVNFPQMLSYFCLMQLVCLSTISYEIIITQTTSYHIKNFGKNKWKMILYIQEYKVIKRAGNINTCDHHKRNLMICQSEFSIQRRSIGKMNKAAVSKFGSK